MRLLTAAVLLATACIRAGPAPVSAREIGAIPNLHEVAGILTAGQPSQADLAAIAETGVATVINIRHPEEIAFDEAALVEDLGMTYVNPAWNGPDELTDEVFEELRRLLATSERPLLFHCGSANRVGANWMAFRVLDEGVPVEQALEEARTIGLRTAAYEEKALDYIKRHR